MRVRIVVDSQFGNTARIAEAIARGATAAGADAVITRAADADPMTVAADADLLLVGGPTQNHGMRPDLKAFLDRLPKGGGAAAAAFDTRMAGSELFLGSAAKGAADRLKKAGFALAAPKESFIVARPPAPKGERPRPELDHLVEGELGRAEAWGSAVTAAAAGRRG